MNELETQAGGEASEGGWVIGFGCGWKTGKWGSGGTEI